MCWLCRLWLLPVVVGTCTSRWTRTASSLSGWSLWGSARADRPRSSRGWPAAIPSWSRSRRPALAALADSAALVAVVGLVAAVVARVGPAVAAVAAVAALVVLVGQRGRTGDGRLPDWSDPDPWDAACSVFERGDEGLPQRLVGGGCFAGGQLGCAAW